MKKSKLILLIGTIILSINIVNAQTLKPQFKGGEIGLIKFVADKMMRIKDTLVIDYHEDAVVDVRFLVGKTGAVSSVTAINGTQQENIDIAVKIVKSMPRWIPGKRKGTITAMYDTLRIDFLMNGGKWTPPAITKNVPMEMDDIDIAVIGGQPVDRDEVLMVVDQMPRFPGGESALMKFITDNLKYPGEAVEEGIEGMVAIRFVVRKTGAVTDPAIIRGVNSSLNEEALRIVNMLPQWTPGKHNGKEVDVYYTLPVRFKLTSKED